MNNLPVPAVVQGGELPVADPVLAKYAAEIRRLGKRVKEDIIEIGRYLDQAQKHAGHGTWLTWIDTEFGWSDQTAYRFIHLYQASQDPEFHNLWNSDLPMSALYRLAAPNTPQEARDEVAERLEAGEQPTCAMVTEVIAKAKNGGAAEDVGGDDVEDDPGTAEHRVAMSPEAEGAPSAEDNPTAKPERTRPAVAPGDEALVGFTACVLELKRRIGKHGPSRFAKTSVAGSDLVWLGEFFEALAQCKGCEPAPKRKPDIPHKHHKHTLNLEANSARNGRGTHSRQ
jgi:hypothetical protein